MWHPLKKAAEDLYAKGVMDGAVGASACWLFLIAVALGLALVARRKP